MLLPLKKRCGKFPIKMRRMGLSLKPRQRPLKLTLFRKIPSRLNFKKSKNRIKMKIQALKTTKR